jgi:hypothetical protein
VTASLPGPTGKGGGDALDHAATAAPRSSPRRLISPGYQPWRVITIVLTGLALAVGRVVVTQIIRLRAGTHDRRPCCDTPGHDISL